AQRSFSPRVRGLEEEDESTRMLPIEEIAAARKPLPRDPVTSTLKSASPQQPAALNFGAPPAGPSFGAPSPEMAPVMGPGPFFGPPMPGLMGPDQGGPPGPALPKKER